MKYHSAGPVAGIRRTRRGSSSSRWVFPLAGVLILAALAAGCAQFDLPRLILPATPTAQPLVGVFATPTPPLQQTSVPKSTPAAQQGFILWLPPQFDPAADTEAGRLLKDRLQAFGKQEPGVNIDVRIKASSGPGGLLESLTAASAAAPDAVPSLVALSRSDLE
ncbi:MAG TPA: hypothetical protein VF813_04005, partial [Anaerolineaceae bacterium]